MGLITGPVPTFIVEHYYNVLCYRTTADTVGLYRIGLRYSRTVFSAATIFIYFKNPHTT